jgi:hypothetical protein
MTGSVATVKAPCGDPYTDSERGQGNLVIPHLDGIKMECCQMGKDCGQETGETHRKTPLDDDEKMDL